MAPTAYARAAQRKRSGTFRLTEHTPKFALMTGCQYPARAKWLLLALRDATPDGLSAVQLQKVLFVFGRRSKAELGAYYSFKPYQYGPFDSAVYADADALANLGLLKIDSSRGRSLRRFALTEEGASAADALAVEVPQQAKDYLRRVVEWAARLSFSALVRSVYESFPEMRANSVFNDG